MRLLRLHPRSIAFALCAASLAACGGAEPAPNTPPSAPAASVAPVPIPPEKLPAAVTTKLDADTPMKTTTGATFTAPKGWTVTASKDLVILVEPDKEATLAFVDSKEPDLEKAIAAAWQVYQPGFARKVEQTTKPPPRDGWEAVVQISYQTAPAEHRLVIANARRKGDVTYVTLADASQAAVGRRGPQLMTAFSSVRPRGMEEERLGGKKAHAFDATLARAFEGFVSDALTRAKIPGAAVAVVQGGKIVYAKGFGVRALGKKEAVGPDTLFMIGSITKSLTSLMMATAVDAGKLSWDTPVTEIYPSFALADGDVTKKLTMKHTLCACTGLPRRDMEFFFAYSRATPESRIAQMRTMKPTTGFGETFQYSNSMVSAGGYIAAHALYPDKPIGPAFDLAMKANVFDAIGMKSTTLDGGTAVRGDHAAPHASTVDLDYVVVPVKTEDWIPPIRPAGGVWSSVNDMARYLMVELGKGKTPEGKQVVSEANLTRRYQPMVKSGDKTAYGLGLGIVDNHGLAVIGHDGGTLGFSTLMMFLPEQDTGFVFLTNVSGQVVSGAVQRRLVELLFDAKPEAAQNLDYALKRRAEVRAAEVAKLDRAPKKEWVDKVARAYENEALGRVTVAWQGERPVLDAGEWKSAFGVAKESDGTEKMVLLDPPYTGFDFLPGTQGDKRTLTLETAQQKYVFVETGKAAPSQR